MGKRESPQVPATQSGAQSPAELRNGDIDPYAAINIRAQRIIQAGLELNEKVWFLRGAKGKKFWKDIEASPAQFAARQRSFAMMLRFVPQKVQLDARILDKRTPSADQLEKMNLSPEAIERLAFGEVEDAQLVVSEKPEGEGV